MNIFEKLFAVESKEIKKDVIITPFLNLEYFRQNKTAKVNKGLLFEVLTEKYFNVIKTGIGASFVGDAVVYLKDTPCERVYFIGSCGAVSNLDIGDLVMPDKILAWESFSEILNNHKSYYFITTKNKLSQNFLELNQNIKIINLATLGSLSLEEEILPFLKQQRIQGADMEVSAFTSAAKYFNLLNLSLLYVTDIIQTKPFFRDLTKEESNIIRESRQRAISLICNFTKRQSV